jgi:hypothetical protein
MGLTSAEGQNKKFLKEENQALSVHTLFMVNWIKITCKHTYGLKLFADVSP